MIIKGICEGWKTLTARRLKLTTREYFRPALQYMNALGGGVLLDMFDSDEIREIFLDYISQLYNQGQNEIFANVDNSYDDIEDEEGVQNVEENEDIVFMREEKEKLDEIKANGELEIDIKVIGSDQKKDVREIEILNKLMGKPDRIMLGCSVVLYILEDNSYVKYDVPQEKETKGWYMIYNYMLGKSIGDSFKLSTKTYIIKNISW